MAVAERPNGTWAVSVVLGRGRRLARSATPNAERTMRMASRSLPSPPLGSREMP